MSQDDRIVERVKKLLRLARDKGATDGEVDNSMALAIKLIAQHDLDERQYLIDQDAPTIAGIIEAHGYTVNKWASWLSALARVPATICGCDHFYRYVKPRGIKTRGGVESFRQRKAVVYVGYTEDAEAAAELMVYLVFSVRAMARISCGPGWTPEHATYADGYAWGLIARADKLRKKQDAATPKDKSGSTAIVLNKKANIDEYMNGLELRTTRSRVSTSSGSSDAYHRGHDDSVDADLSRPDRSPRKGIGKQNKLGSS